MSTFSGTRKPRTIRTFNDDDEEKDAPNPQAGAAPSEQIKDYQNVSLLARTASTPPAPIKFGKRALKQSSLRKSINAADAEALGRADDATVPTSAPPAAASTHDDDGDDGPAVVRPALSRAGSTKKKTKRLSSRLSFGGEASDAGGDGDGEGAFSTPRKATLSAKALENSALRSRLPLPRQPADDDRPRYSKESLDELASSTPNTPRDLPKLKPGSDDDEMMLDASELEGAMVVSASELGGMLTRPPGSPAAAASVLTEAQIRERKERRARLALEQEFVALDGASGDEDGNEADFIPLRPKKKKDESRLIAEDEDLGEGYEDFVEDGGLSLGKKAEREARRRHRAEMAELINAAEGEDGESSDDSSEAERRDAYDEAQTRAGMDGGLRLQQQRRRDDPDGDGVGPPAIPKMKPLPDLGECLAGMQAMLRGMESDVAAKRARIADLEREKDEILAREVEVQSILDQAGKKYQAALGTAAPVSVPASGLAPGSSAQSPSRPLPSGIVGRPVERGLESFGTTPTRRPDVEDVG